MDKSTTYIKTFQDGTNLGVFSQINFSNGSKALLSFTATEFAVFKVGFMGMPTKKLFVSGLLSWLHILSVEVGYAVDSFPGGSKSPLKISVNVALECKSISELVNRFEQMRKNSTA
ncbi:hypothetical protein H6775_01450 [Candidatus Nomurabacteria bacterium]|nr:hypothetical protein [Candidatus Nomurabacteria bacterium]